MILICLFVLKESICNMIAKGMGFELALFYDMTRGLNDVKALYEYLNLYFEKDIGSLM